MPGIATALFQLIHNDVESLQVVKSVFTCPTKSQEFQFLSLCFPDMDHDLSDISSWHLALQSLKLMVSLKKTFIWLSRASKDFTF